MCDAIAQARGWYGRGVAGSRADVRLPSTGEYVRMTVGLRDVRARYRFSGLTAVTAASERCHTATHMYKRP